VLRHQPDDLQPFTAQLGVPATPSSLQFRHAFGSESGERILIARLKLAENRPLQSVNLDGKWHNKMRKSLKTNLDASAESCIKLPSTHSTRDDHRFS
jgi:hypothetical protein